MAPTGSSSSKWFGLGGGEKNEDHPAVDAGHEPALEQPVKPVPVLALSGSPEPDGEQMHANT
jgi:hypothetical protein